MERMLPLTVRSMEEAAHFAKSRLNVELFSAQFNEDRKAVPFGWKKTTNLERSMHDKDGLPRLKKLPFIGDILKRLYESTDADFLVYTNADIILTKEFYVHVEALLKKGHDALIINRRRVPYKSYQLDKLDDVFQAKSKSHPGFDCFVFHRELFPKFITGDICIGIPFIGVSLAHNLFAHAQNLLFLDKAFLTYHVGMDVLVKHQPDYYWHNRNQFFKLVKPALWNQWDTRKFPYGKDHFLRRYYKWGMNPSLFIYMNFKLEMKRKFGWFKNG